MHRAVLLAVVLLGALAPAAVASTPQPRIINGQAASPGEYPAQGFLEVNLGNGLAAACGGTVVAPRKFVTAGHCVADEGDQARPPTVFRVFLGEVNQSDFRFAERPVVSAAALHPDYAGDGGAANNDVAVLTFADPVSVAPARLIRPDATALWAPGVLARIIGWGSTEFAEGSNALLEADVPIRTDASLRRVRRCLRPADDGVRGRRGSSEQLGHLLGRLRWAAARRQPQRVRAHRGCVVRNGCNERGFPGVYTRVGSQPLNAWIRGQINGVDFTIPTATPRAGEPVAFAATAPAGAAFSWDFDNDGAFDATGPSPTHVYGTAGEFEAVLRITDPEGQPAEQRHALVAPGAPPSSPIVAPPTTTARATRLATIVATGRPRVRRGRFNLRITFAATAPSGIATIEVFRQEEDRQRQDAGAPRRLQARQRELTKTGRRLLRTSSSKRLRVKIRVRVGRHVLRTKQLTIRR